MKIRLNPKGHPFLKRVSLFLVTVVLIVGIVGCGVTPSGTEIRDWYDLDAIRDNLNGAYLLMNDLDSTTAGYEELASETANGGRGWQPIGIEVYPSIDDPFTGTFDGQGYEISDLYISRVDEWEVGLFGYVEGGRIKNIGVVDATVAGKGEVGGLVGENYGTVSNSYATGSVTGTQRVGGLVGLNRKAISNSYSAGNATGNSGIGGLMGLNWGTVSNCYAAGSVSGGEYVGGLLGVNSATIRNSYSTGNVTGNRSVGGLVGLNEFDGTVNNSYAKGSVIGDEFVGGLMGGNVGHVSNCFWDTETSGQANSDGGTSKNTTEMQDIATFSEVGWSIGAVALNDTDPAYIWNIVNNVTYPFLSWQS